MHKLLLNQLLFGRIKLSSNGDSGIKHDFEAEVPFPLIENDYTTHVDYTTHLGHNVEWQMKI